MRATTGLVLLRAARAAADSASSAAPTAAAAAAPLASLCAQPNHRRDSSSSSTGSSEHGRAGSGDGALRSLTRAAAWSRVAAVGPTSSRAAFSSSAAASSHSAEMHGTTVLAVRHRGSIVIVADGQISMGSKVVKPNARKLRRLLPDAGLPAAAAPPSSDPSSSSSSPTADAADAPGPPLPLGDLSSLPGGGLVIGGFAGSSADGLALFERLESRLRQHPGQLRRAAVDLAKAWRQDRVLRRLRAAMLVADATGACLEVSGNGDVLEPADGVHAIGSGARYALAAARALVRLDADDNERRKEGGGAALASASSAGSGEDGDSLAPAAAAAAAPAAAASAAPARKGLFTALDIAQRAMRVASDRCVYTNTCWTWEGIDEGTGASFSGGSGDGGGGKQEQQQQQQQRAG